MKSFIPIILSLICAIGLCASTQPQTAQNAPPLDPKNIDPSVKPGDDFFKYANGAWIKRTEIPPEYSRWGAFNELIERNNDSLHTIAEKASETPVDPKLAPETQNALLAYVFDDETAVDLSDEDVVFLHWKMLYTPVAACTPAVIITRSDGTGKGTPDSFRSMTAKIAKRP